MAVIIVILFIIIIILLFVTLRDCETALGDFLPWELLGGPLLYLVTKT